MLYDTNHPVEIMVKTMFKESNENINKTLMLLEVLNYKIINEIKIDEISRHYELQKNNMVIALSYIYDSVINKGHILVAVIEH